MSRRLFWAGAIIALLATPVACLELTVAGQISAARESAARELTPRLSKDRALIEKVSAMPLFAPASSDDAGSLLNGKLRWDDLPGDGGLVSSACTATLTAAGTSWRTIDPATVGGCDTSIVHELRRFGRWNMSSGPRASVPPGKRSAFALPDYASIQQLAKLHLLKAQGAEREEAAQDVRHLARLLITTEYMVSIMVALAVFGIEQVSWEQAERAWSPPPISGEELAGLRAHLMLAIYAVNPHAPVAAQSEVLGLAGFRRCMGLTEAAFGGRSLDASAPECALDHARWELAHPYVTTPLLTDIESMNVVARAGAQIEQALIPSRASRLAIEFLYASALPTEEAWRKMSAP